MVDHLGFYGKRQYFHILRLIREHPDRLYSFSAQSLSPLVLRTMLDDVKPPRSNLRAARLCKHRLARA